jgi:hypothetical protein
MAMVTFMDKPRPGHVLPIWASLGFEVHEVIGILSLAILLCWFVWLSLRSHYARGEAGPQELYPSGIS